MKENAVTDYASLRKLTNWGWNTWNSSNMMCHAHLPEGFAINLALKDFGLSPLLRNCLITRNGGDGGQVLPRLRTYDGSYTELQVRYGKLEVRVRSTVVNDEQIILIDPLTYGIRPGAVLVEAVLLWGREGEIRKRNGVLSGTAGGREFTVYTDGTRTELPHSESNAPSIALILDCPTVISTCPCTAAEAERLCAEAQERMLSDLQHYGAHAESLGAMRICLAWDTIYEPEHDRICSPVSRVWSRHWGGYALFDWDTYFAALMMSAESPELAMCNAIAITDECTEDGFIPNFGTVYGGKSRDRSQPPVGAAVCMEIYRQSPQRWFLEHVYPLLRGWNRWFAEHRMTSDGYLCWGSDPCEPRNGMYFELQDVANRQAAAYESGLDNLPAYDDVPFNSETHRMELADVGLMGLYLMDCDALTEMARILGDEAAIAEFQGRHAKVAAALETLWSEELGIHLNRRTDTGELSPILSITNFYALYDGTLSIERKRRILEHLYNPQEFWGEYVIPTSCRADASYHDQNYWRGRIWAPTNYLVWRALRHAGLTADAKTLADKSERLFLKEWREHGHVHENYNGDTGEGCDVGNSDPFYHWGGLLAYMQLAELNDDKKRQ